MAWEIKRKKLIDYVQKIIRTAAVLLWDSNVEMKIKYQRKKVVFLFFNQAIPRFVK